MDRGRPLATSTVKDDRWWLLRCEDLSLLLLDDEW